MSSFTAPIASFASSTFTPDSLVLSLDDLLSHKITLKSGAGALARGTVLGKITLGAVTSAAKSGGNTGTGTCTVDATTPLLGNAKAGIYTVRFVVAATNNGSFIVSDPLGRVIGEVVMAAGAGTFAATDIKFAIADGGTDFVVGDGFDITVAAGSGKYLKALAAAVDGSQVPDCILDADTDATSADADAMGHFRGRFNSNAVTIGAGLTLAGITEGLRGKGVDLVSSVAA